MSSAGHSRTILYQSKTETMSSQPQPFSVPVLFTELDHEPKKTWIEYGAPEKRRIPKGWTKDEGRRPFPVDVLWEKDVRIPLRDGVELLADVFRPVTSDEEPVPAIMPWSPYGKTGSGMQQLDVFPWRVGVPRAATSGLEKWEAPDPAEWVARGYAVVNIDARGAFKSGGDLHVYGTQEGRDGHDSIEWIAGRPWCNAKVTMAGNSWLGTTQWFIAAERPPHLACMAPWEGCGDYYRESICRGGIPDHAFWDVLMAWFCGSSRCVSPSRDFRFWCGARLITKSPCRSEQTRGCGVHGRQVQALERLLGGQEAKASKHHGPHVCHRQLLDGPAYGGIAKGLPALAVHGEMVSVGLPSPVAQALTRSLIRSLPPPGCAGPRPRNGTTSTRRRTSTTCRSSSTSTCGASTTAGRRPPRSGSRCWATTVPPWSTDRRRSIRRLIFDTRPCSLTRRRGL